MAEDELWSEDELWEDVRRSEAEFDARVEEGEMLASRLEVYEKGIRCHPLRDLARLWSAELERVGLTDTDAGSYVPKRAETYDLKSEMISGELVGDLYPVRLDDSQRTVWLNLDGDRAAKGYKNIEIFDRPLRTDVALIAALTALEGSAVRPFKRMPGKVVAALKAPIAEEKPKSLREVFEDLKDKCSARQDAGLLLALEPLNFPMALLHERRPGFDNLPYQEQFALLAGTCDRIYEFLEALRKLLSFLEFGTFDSARGKATLPNRTTQNADRYIQAAILRDVEGMSHLEIAKIMNVSIPRNYKHKKDIEAVRDLYDKGRMILDRALGKGGWQERTEDMKADIEWWSTLSNEDKKEEEFSRFSHKVNASATYYENWIKSNKRRNA